MIDLSTHLAAHAAPSSTDLVIDVTDADFAAAVLDRSVDVPVLLDVWAPWCGPCKTLGPVLEKLAREYEGRFVLAKLNADDSPQVAAALRARSIPLVVLFDQGRPVDQFMGALPEGQIRSFLDRHLQPTVSPAEQLRLDAQQAATAEQAEALLREALALDPGHDEARLDLVARRLDARDLDDAQALLDAVPGERRGERHAALRARLALGRDAPPGDADALRQRLAADPRDFDAAFALAAVLAHESRFADAFECLLEVVQRDKGDARERARSQLVEWFGLCPDRQLVSRGRRLLGMYLN